jgi:ribosomal protein S18 acetylase RimI-like enzyme
MDVNYIIINTPTMEQSRQIAGLYQAQWWLQGYDDDRPQLIRRLVEGSHCFVVALEGEEIVGMGRAISDRISDAYIQDLTVRSNRRNQGIGAKILQTLLERLHADGLHWIGLIAEPGSCNLYRNAGFREMPAAVPMLMNRDS